MSNPFLDLLKPSKQTPSPEPISPTPAPQNSNFVPSTGTNPYLNILKKPVEAIRSIPVPTVTAPNPRVQTGESMTFRVGEGLSPEQTKTAYETIAKPDSAMNEAKSNSFLGILKKEFTPRTEAVPVRRAFEKEPIMTKAPPIVTQAAGLGFSILEMIPRGLATLYGETVAPDKNTGEVSLPISGKRLGYETDTYPTAKKEFEDAIAKGEDPLTAGIRIVSEKTLDVTIGGQVISSIFKNLEKQLLRGGVQAQSAAWESLGKATTIEQAEKNKAKQISEASKAMRNKPLDERERVVSELNNTLNKSLEVLKTEGIPGSGAGIRKNLAGVSEVIGRQTDIGKTRFLDILKPDVSLKPRVLPEVPIAGELPGTAPVNPNQQPMGLSTQEVKRVGYGDDVSPEAPRLTLKTIDKLEGRESVSKQFISDLTNSGDIKQVERDIIRGVLSQYPEGSKITVAEFADKVNAELLPLNIETRTSEGQGGYKAQYENITLPDDLRGNVADYVEHIYESPIKTSAGEIHFQERKFPNYFGHTRIEDMADNKTRRVIEVQSDLYQKGGLSKYEDVPVTDKNGKTTIQKLEIKNNEIETGEDSTKLFQYNDPTAHFRMVREEIKKAAQDGKTKLQFPTGETAMKIEGLGQTENNFLIEDDSVNYGARDLNSDDLKVGSTIYQSSLNDFVAGGGENAGWTITDVLGDGKFKAVPKRLWDEKARPELNTFANESETFDISGKVDTNNPIYRFYEKDMGRYLINNYKAKIVTDGNGVSWYEVPISKEIADKPVQAFTRSLFNKNIAMDPEKIRDIILDGIGKAGYTAKDLRILFTDELIEGGSAKGVFYTDKIMGDIMKVYEKNGKAGLVEALHESKHFLFSKLPVAQQKEALAIAKKEIGPLYMTVLRAAYPKVGKYAGVTREDALLEEYIVDKWSKAEAGDHGYKKSIYGVVFEALDNLLKKLVDIYKKITDNIKKTPNKQGGFINLGGGKKISRADELIAEGKIRVVSRNGRDVYQTKKGGEWVNARDEDSAVRKVTEPKSKTSVPIIELPKKLEEKRIELEIRKETIDQNPAKGLERYYDSRLGGLPEVGLTRYQIENPRTKVSKWKKMGDQISMDLGYEDSEVAREAFDKYLKIKREYRADLKEFNAEKRDYISQPKEKPAVISAVEKPKSIPLVETNTGEGRSLEILADQELQKIDEPFRKDISSLPEIIAREATSVKQKINLLDYIRTPDRVLKKIGFGNEAALLRKGYEDYLKELPKNIDKITKWSNEASKTGTEYIFKYLDGEAVTLTPGDQKIAEEIRAWLKEWADRLGLPEDNQITHYITHIFDKELLAKEFDEDLAKIIADKLPGQVYDPFLEKRLGAKGYKQDVWQALDAYVKRATRKVHMDPALEMIREKAGSSLEYSNIEASQWKFLQHYINNVNMRPTDLDNLIDNTIKNVVGYKYGQRPVTYITKLLRQMTFRGMLGLNPGSALRNLSQGANTFASLGPRYTTTGYAKLFSPSAYAELEREGVLNTGFIQDRALSSTKKAMEKIDKGLFFFFDTAEKINRGAAYFGAKSKGISKGMSEEQAIEYAKKTVRDTQFSFGSIDTPVALQSDIVKTLSQFQTFTVKQIEFLTEMAKDKNFMGLLRYGIAGLVFVYTIGRAFGMKPEDLIPAFRFGTPPSLKLPVEITKAALNTPDKFGQKRDMKKKLEDIGNAGIGLIPAGTQAKKTIQGLKSVEEGGVYDKGGKLMYEQGQTKAQKIQSGIFGKYASKEAEEYFNKSETKKKEQAPIKKIYDQVQELVKDGKEDEARALVDGLSDADYETYKDVRTAAKAEATKKAQQDVYPTFLKVQQLKDSGDTAGAQALVDAMTDEEYLAYGLLKKKNDQKDSLPVGDKTKAERSFLGLISAYAKAYTIDPSNAWKAMTTKEQLGDVEGNLVGFERFFGKDYNGKGGSEEYVYKLLDQMGIPKSERKNYNLEHIVPLDAGGDNDPTNLKIVDRATHNSWTEFDIAIGKALQNKSINRKEAEQISRDYKSGKITRVEAKQKMMKVIQ